jgi:hypothetical protein
MIPLFFCALVDTVAVTHDLQTVRVHEWGVVQLDYGPREAVGAEWCYPDDHGIFQYGGMMMVDAPVVWFHGPDFTGTFTVDIWTGNLTVRYPEPDRIEEQPALLGGLFPSERVVWEGLVGRNDRPLDDRFSADRISSTGCDPESFRWAVPWWREVPSLTVSRESDRWSDRFIYYECTTEAFSVVDDLPVQDETMPCSAWQGTYSGPALVFAWDTEDGGLLVESIDVEMPDPDIHSADLSEFVPVDPDRMAQILCMWARSNFKSEEMTALWRTWEPVIRTRCGMFGERIMLFPLPGETVESISTLHLETDQGYFVEYHRLFLGLTGI